MKSTILILLFALFVGGCARKSAETMYEEARAAEERGDNILAISTYEEIARRFEKSSIAESSLYRGAVLANNELREVPRAVRLYKKLYESFPESKQAPLSLFLCAFLLNNELRHIDSARVCYEEFLAKYPDHELAASARFELEFLGMDPAVTITDDASPVAGGESHETQADQKASRQ